DKTSAVAQVGAVVELVVVAGEGAGEAGALAGVRGVGEAQHRHAVALPPARDRAGDGVDAGAGAGAVPGGVRVDGGDRAADAVVAVGDGRVAAAVDDQGGHAD